jgi:hypothetical protein
MAEQTTSQAAPPEVEQRSMGGGPMSAPQATSLLTAPGEPPPITFPIDITLLDVLKQLYVFSQELADNPPTIGILYADTIQVMWPKTDTYAGNACYIRIKFEANSGAAGGPGIEPFPFAPY